MSLFSLKQGALLPAIELTLLPVGFTYDLASATAVEFRYRRRGGSVETITCSVADAALYKVTMTPAAGLVDEIGVFECHVRVTLGGKYLYFPQSGFDTFEVTETF